MKHLMMFLIFTGLTTALVSSVEAQRQPRPVKPTRGRHTLKLRLGDLPPISVPVGEPQTFHLQFKDSPTYRGGTEPIVRDVVLRRVEFVTPVPKQKLEYLKLEVWLTNTSVDVCAAPELAEIASIPLASDEDFVLVWQGIDYGWGGGSRGGGNSHTAAASTFFSEAWLRDATQPGALEWMTTQRLRDPDARRGLHFELGNANWLLHHAAIKGQRYKEFLIGDVVLGRIDGTPMLWFDTQTKGLTATGRLRITNVCPDIRRDTKFWLDDKVPH